MALYEIDEKTMTAIAQALDATLRFKGLEAVDMVQHVRAALTRPVEPPEEKPEE